MLAAVAACGSAAPGSGPAASDVIEATTGGCGGPWHLAHPGTHTFTVGNQASDGADIYLVNPHSGAIFAQVEGLGPGTTEPMTVDVGSGSYAFECVIEDYDPIYGPTVTVPGNTAGTPGILPVTDDTLIPAAKQYQVYVEAGLGKLVTQVSALAADVRAGNLTAARRDWLTAHLTYESLGAAYDSFDDAATNVDFDQEIDGRADGLKLGVSDPGFTGFYRIEYGLWHGQSAAELSGPVGTLVHDVKQLDAFWPSMEQNLLDMGLRTHEILENALEFQLSGHDDYGSGTTLATTEANVKGTLELLSLLHPVLVPRYAALPSVYSALSDLQSLLLAEDHSSGWVPVADLPASTREAIDAACDQALTVLAPIAVITEPRLVNP
jgi:iron uptake system component EfeO